MSDPRFLNVGIDRSPDNDLILRFRGMAEGGDLVTLYEHRITPEDQVSFLRDVTNTILQNLSDTAVAMVRGDCPTCRNYRLVDKPGPGGRMSNEYCPDCNTTGRTGAFSTYPIAGGGFAPRQPKESPDA